MNEQYKFVDRAVESLHEMDFDSLTPEQQEKFIAIHGALMTFSHELEYGEDE